MLKLGRLLVFGGVLLNNIREVVIPAAGPRTELPVREVYVLASWSRLCGANPALLVKLTKGEMYV
jgi:hypothetical protein